MLTPLSALLGGAAVAVQIAMNGQTRQALGGPLWSAMANNAVGLVGLCVAVLVLGARAPGVDSLRSVPVPFWSSGLLGAAFITMTAWVGPRLGLATTFGLVLAGQLGASLLIDHFGWLSGSPRPTAPSALLGVGLVFLGALLVARAR